MSIEQFKVKLEDKGREFTHVLNCSDELSARFICEGMWPTAEVKSVEVSNDWKV